MLVLSRKIGEKIYVGENISIEVRRIAGNRVTLAIDAPKEIRILRGELKAAVDAFQEPVAMEPVATGSMQTEVIPDYSVSHHRVRATDGLCYTI